MFDPLTLCAITAVFLLAGAVKGVIGLGLPSVSLALITILIDMPSAMALLLVPSFATNLWQALVGGHAGELIRRLWPFFLTASLTVWLGALVLVRVDLAYLSGLLGLLLAAYAALSLAGVRLNFRESQERLAGPALGTVNGVLTGMTGSFVVPGVMYLQAIGLSRDALIQAMGVLFTLSTVALAISLQRNSMLDLHQGVISLAALLPAILGMILGQRIRRNLSEQVFRRVFFVSLLMLGGYIVVNALIG